MSVDILRHHEPAHAGPPLVGLTPAGLNPEIPISQEPDNSRALEFLKLSYPELASSSPWIIEQSLGNVHRKYVLNLVLQPTRLSKQFFEEFLEGTGWDDTTRDQLRGIRMANDSAWRMREIEAATNHTKIVFPQEAITDENRTTTSPDKIIARAVRAKNYLELDAPEQVRKSSALLTAAGEIFDNSPDDIPGHLHPLFLDPTHVVLFTRPTQFTPQETAYAAAD